MPNLLITNPGIFTTIQDQGRNGFLQYGLSTAGALDKDSMILANQLVGNKENEAVLECTAFGPNMTFEGDDIIAITGGSVKAKLNGVEISMYRSIQVQAGDQLSIGAIRTGMRTYIAFASTIAVEPIMGSKSTYIRGKLGGLHGDKLKKDDAIPMGELTTKFVDRYIPETSLDPIKKEIVLRVVLGPQNDRFTKDGLDTFLNTAYTVSNECDRMGYRLEGETAIEHENGFDIISDGTAFGAVQVPGSGMPIILFADRGTTGGYTKIATVLSVDMNKLAQVGPGSTIRFQEVSVAEANRIFRDHHVRLQKMIHNPSEYLVRINGNEYNISVARQ